eukprot:COSAG05_NODE_1637_length_4363_cov_2.634146_3_plen_52_part_00
MKNKNETDLKFTVRLYGTIIAFLKKGVRRAIYILLYIFSPSLIFTTKTFSS